MLLVYHRDMIVSLSQCFLACLSRCIQRGIHAAVFEKRKEAFLPFFSVKFRRVFSASGVAVCVLAERAVPRVWAVVFANVRVSLCCLSR